MKPQEENAAVAGQVEADTYLVHLSGTWTVHATLPDWQAFITDLPPARTVSTLRFDLSQVTAFDSILVTFVLKTAEAAEAHNLSVAYDSLPPEIARLMELARKVPLRDDAHRHLPEPPLLEKVGESTFQLGREVIALAEFIGEACLALVRLVTGKSRMRLREFWLVLESVSIKALPIVILISFLVGVIISFLGAVTLRRFGAEFAVSYLVGYGMLREMGAVMTGIIMAGRTGAAFAAEIGSMKVNEEIDALRTLGISPIDYLVLPRLLALFFMLPVLTVFANVVGITSGWLVAELLMGVPTPVFFLEMTRVVGIPDFALGIVKASVFGLLIGVSGCLRGLQCGAGADAVGRATTSAVVTGITLIIFANAVIDWLAAILDV